MKNSGFSARRSVRQLTLRQQPANQAADRHSATLPGNTAANTSPESQSISQFIKQAARRTGGQFNRQADKQLARYSVREPVCQSVVKLPRA
ncbi:hypothetical protein E2C01_083222 [Portunus trituberculatus]|uniref:Uncharacterized protein n=1 Tax=Portunus trituberculatus TaxID=210409 RepID=A0A5B7IRW4_PORTR|nr:hypothetical protein [Portunus trituberculatus]